MLPLAIEFMEAMIEGIVPGAGVKVVDVRGKSVLTDVPCEAGGLESKIIALLNLHLTNLTLSLGTREYNEKRWF